MAVTLFFIYYSRISYNCTQFVIAESTVCEIVHETTAAIVNDLLDRYIKFPVGDQLQSVVNGL